MAYKLSLLCTNDVSSGRSTSGQTLTVNTDDEGVIFDSGKPLNPLQLVVPVGLLSPGPDAPSQVSTSRTGWVHATTGTRIELSEVRGYVTIRDFTFSYEIFAFQKTTSPLHRRSAQRP